MRERDAESSVTASLELFVKLNSTITGWPMSTAACCALRSLDSPEPEPPSSPPPAKRARHATKPMTSNTGSTTQPPKASFVPRHTVDFRLGGGGAVVVGGDCGGCT